MGCVYIVCSPLSKGEEPKFWKFQEWGTWKKLLVEGNQKGDKIFKNKGGTQLFKLNLGIEKNEIGDF